MKRAPQVLSSDTGMRRACEVRARARRDSARDDRWRRRSRRGAGPPPRRGRVDGTDLGTRRFFAARLKNSCRVAEVGVTRRPAASPVNRGGRIHSDEHAAMGLTAVCFLRRTRVPSARVMGRAAALVRSRSARTGRPSPRDANRPGPAAQRRPRAGRLARQRPRADPAPDLADRLAGDQSGRQRQRGRGEPVVLARRDAARHDRQDGAAVHAVAPACEREHGRRPGRGRRPAQLALPHPVPVEPKQAAGRPPRLPAATRRGPRCVERRRVGQPGLDVERVMDDLWSASGRAFQRGPARSTTSAVR